MDLEKLAFNKLTKEEQEKWNELKQLVKECCDKNVLEEYTGIVNDALRNVVIEDHISGYSMGNGYYYVVEGDYGELSLELLTGDIKEMAFYILKSIYYLVASDIEIKNRTIYQKDWMYFHDKNSANEEGQWKKNTEFMYHTYYDPRKYVFESVLKRLKLSFEKKYFTKTIQDYENYLNLWFDDVHWKYNEETTLFDEISNSIDKRFRKK